MLLGYKPRFVDPILIGTKVHTMRKPRKVKPKIGETLHMYTGLRTAHCKLITKKEKLISVQKAQVHIKRIKLKGNGYTYQCAIKVDGKRLSPVEGVELIKFDGFKSTLDFCEFWFANVKGNTIKETLDLYHWTDLKY